MHFEIILRSPFTNMFCYLPLLLDHFCRLCFGWSNILVSSSEHVSISLVSIIFSHNSASPIDAFSVELFFKRKWSFFDAPLSPMAVRIFSIAPLTTGSTAVFGVVSLVVKGFFTFHQLLPPTRTPSLNDFALNSILLFLLFPSSVPLISIVVRLPWPSQG